MGKHKILIVEDDSNCRELLRFFLRQSGYETVEAATGFEAVSLARVTRPNLIIMDLGMPAMTGDQATARLKAAHPRETYPSSSPPPFPMDHFSIALLARGRTK